MLTLRWRIIYWLTFLPMSVLFFLILLVKGFFFRIFIVPTLLILKKIFFKTKNKKPIRLLCFAYLNDINASARHRLYKYLDYIRENDVQFSVVPPTSFHSYQKLFLPWQRSGQYKYFIIVFIKRFMAVWSASRYDAVFLQREILSEFFYDPPLFVFVLWLLNRNIIYDVDDATWMLPPQSVRARSRVLNRLARSRFYWYVRLSRHVIAGNKNIERHVKAIHERVDIIPTPVDVKSYPVEFRKPDATVVVGWTGGPGNLSYLKLVEKPLATLSRIYPLELHVICSRGIKLKGVDVKFIPWDKTTEIGHICRFDIGIMPLTDNSYTRGKGGFKILEYMAAGLPTVASPVGVNAHLISQNRNGYTASNEQDWERYLGILIADRALRERMGQHAREYVEAHYDYSRWVSTFSSIIQKVAAENR